MATRSKSTRAPPADLPTPDPPTEMEDDGSQGGTDGMDGPAPKNTDAEGEVAHDEVTAAKGKKRPARTRNPSAKGKAMRAEHKENSSKQLKKLPANMG